MGVWEAERGSGNKDGSVQKMRTRERKRKQQSKISRKLFHDVQKNRYAAEQVEELGGSGRRWAAAVLVEEEAEASG